MKIVKHILTDFDNETYDTSRVVMVMVIGAMLFMQAWTVIYLKQPFNASEFGVGMGAILTGFGFSVAGENLRRPPPVPRKEKQDD